MKKTDKKWIILCSTAVAAVYSAGYLTTENQVSIEQPIHQVAKNIQTNNKAVNDGSVSNAQKNKLYKDGTFTGTGMNRRGSIDVMVTIQNDKITNVEISDFAMHYSESDIVGLPDEVLKNQGARVINVSGATYSTEAFEDAVQDALNQAFNTVG
ncbi:FMN-binding protein [Neobacillus sp. PS2-9]|uniref:FMN-binding protein n=1 Tax=Neobacillus sp. PS2-9 TaxID=3070676 RepID=UPI0027E1D7EC|nr:FMN-binding protein [Neobacillus sp. PS2-9]WML57414.1 FMN-binding protein [Neobacillus sp. PS2-9]